MQDGLVLLELLVNERAGMSDQVKTPEQAAAARAIAVLGGPVAAARILRVKDERYQTVQSWIANRVPSDYCPTIERETRLRGDVVSCEELRSDVAWAVLREQVGQPEATVTKIARKSRATAKA